VIFVRKVRFYPVWKVFCLTNIDNLTFFVFKKVTTTRLNKGEKGEFTPQNTPKNTDFDDKSGEKWTRTLQDGSEFTFKYEYDEVDGGIKMFFGIVYWGGTEWSGCIVVDEDGSLGMLDFVEDTGDYQTYDITDPFARPEGNNDKYLLNELGNLSDEVEYFVEDEIIPDLID